MPEFSHGLAEERGQTEAQLSATLEVDRLLPSLRPRQHVQAGLRVGELLHEDLDVPGVMAGVVEVYSGGSVDIDTWEVAAVHPEISLTPLVQVYSPLPPRDCRHKGPQLEEPLSLDLRHPRNGKHRD